MKHLWTFNRQVLVVAPHGREFNSHHSNTASIKQPVLCFKTKRADTRSALTSLSIEEALLLKLFRYHKQLFIPLLSEALY